MSAKLKEPSETISMVAALCLEESNGNLFEATNRFEKRVRQDQRLFASLMEPLVRSACAEAVRKVQHTRRNSVWNGKAQAATSGRDQVVALANATLRSLFDFPLPNGVTLRSATKQEILEAASFYQKQASDMGHKAHWLGAIAEKLPDGARAADVLTEADLAFMKEEAVSA